VTVLRLQNVHIVAQDIERATNFWQGALGLPVRFRDADRWVQLQAGQQGFAISSQAEGVPGQIGAVPVFEVDDLEAQAASITEHGGQILSTRDMGSHGSVVTFSDPEGNVAQLLFRAARSG
jgi:predicted enzyme related to lactoylglutathione lyase